MTSRQDDRRRSYRVTESMILTADGRSLPSGWRPNVDVYETEQAIVLVIELAGVDPQSIDVDVAGRRVTVSGTRAPAVRGGARRIHHLEIPYGRFDVGIDLSAAVDSRLSEALWNNGLLEVKLPFPQPVRPSIGGRKSDQSSLL